jgi:hypothetical protein
MTEIHFVRVPGEGGAESTFEFWLGKVRQNPALMDQKIPACTFAELGTLLVPGTSEEDWQ